MQSQAFGVVDNGAAAGRGETPLELEQRHLARSVPAEALERRAQLGELGVDAPTTPKHAPSAPGNHRADNHERDRHRDEGED